jgi:hypothetical protein
VLGFCFLPSSGDSLVPPMAHALDAAMPQASAPRLALSLQAMVALVYLCQAGLPLLDLSWDLALDQLWARAMGLPLGVAKDRASVMWCPL